MIKDPVVNYDLRSEAVSRDTIANFTCVHMWVCQAASLRFQVSESNHDAYHALCKGLYSRACKNFSVWVYGTYREITRARVSYPEIVSRLSLPLPRSDLSRFVLFLSQLFFYNFNEIKYSSLLYKQRLEVRPLQITTDLLHNVE